jgi:hypothetical protein
MVKSSKYGSQQEDGNFSYCENEDEGYIKCDEQFNNPEEVDQSLSTATTKFHEIVSTEQNDSFHGR